MPRTIARRVFLACAVTLAVALAAVAVVVPAVARQQEADVLGARLAADAALAADLAAADFERVDDGALDALAHRLARDAGVRVTLIARDGTVLGESDEDRRAMENHASRPEVAVALIGGEGRSIRHSATLGRDLLYVARAAVSGSRVIGVARAALPLSAVDALVRSLALVVLAAAAAGGAVALGVAFVLGRASARPLVELTERARQARPGEQFAVRGPDEVETLGAALRRMSAEAAGQRHATEIERDRLAALIGELSDGIVILGPDDRVRLANPAATRLLAAGDLTDRPLVEVIRDHEILQVVRSARAGAETATTVERAQPQRFIRAVAKPLEDGELLVTLQDLSTLRRLETVRRDFVANVSHELRTPIASLKVMAETLHGGAIDDPLAARDFVERMRREIDGLAQLVEELLALARIESGRETLRFAAIAPRILLADAARRMGALVERGGLTISIDAPEDLPLVRADAERAGQVLVNLIHNAAKFTPPGGTIRLEARRQEGRDGMVAFSVRDTGMGIEAGDLDRVFERFYKGDQARSAGAGTGLGLAVAKHVVQAHGGEIGAASAGAGQGATFTFTLPIAE
jgi:two-component system phosphate regulon sensor histidine kinase PhoR